MKRDRDKLTISLLISLMLMVSACVLAACSSVTAGEKDSKDAAVKEENLIEEDEAISIALEKVPGAGAENVVKFYREQEDDHIIYVGEIRYEGIEYEFEIEACTGNILLWELDN